MKANYDESLVPEYELPDPLIFTDGSPVEASHWPRRRAEIHRIFEQEVYGSMPPAHPMSAETFDDETALDGTARRRQVRLRFGGYDDAPCMDLLLYLPHSDAPVPVFLGLNFSGNHAIHPDPAIRLSPVWMRSDEDNGVVDHQSTDASRGAMSSRWSVDALLTRGYGLATVYCGDLDPDFDDGFDNGVHPLFDRGARTPHSWGSIGAWAWGLSRALDYLVTQPDIDHNRVSVMGHSRLGKTALWAGACDERFAMVVSNNSGCGGAALARRRFGETIARINTTFPYWFCQQHHTYNDREDDLPIDQHQLLALAAPRPLYVASAVDDGWADPKGEFLAAAHASPVYELLGHRGLGATQMPDVGVALTQGRVGYHVRSGGHDVTLWDWERWMDFADHHLRSEA